MTPYALKVSGRTDPMEVDDPRPRFSWRLAADTGDVQAVLTEVLVLTSAGTPVWSSGPLGGEPIAVRYAGPVLASCSEYVWQVRLTGKDGVSSTAAAQFETGFIGGDRPQGAWIGRDPSPWLDPAGNAVDTRLPSVLDRSWRTMYSAAPLQLRRRFHIDGQVVGARLLITARGIYQAHINGHRVGRNELTPGWTRYETRIEYQRYDVIDLIQPGDNVIAVEVADGWWSGYVGYDTRSQAMQYGNAPSLFAQLTIELPDERLTVETDSQWRELPGARVTADLLMGESRDARLTTTGWTEAGFDDSGWRPAAVLGSDVAVLSGQTAEPVRCTEEIPALTVNQNADRIIVDFGTNLTGRLRLCVEGAEDGDIITVRHGETLEAGELYTANLRTAEATDRYLLLAGADQQLEPAFTLHGFRYAEIRGLRGSARPEQFTAVVLSSALEPTGDVRTSSLLVNQLMQNIRRSQVGNFVGLPTDCPQRDERLGWTADAQVFAPTAAFNQDVGAFFRSWLSDLQMSQDTDGRVPDIAPVPPRTIAFADGAPGWGDAAVIVPWTLFQVYGDQDLLRHDLDSMLAWVAYVRTKNQGQLWTRGVGNHFGDWLAVGDATPKDLIAAAYQIRSTDLTAAACRILDDPRSSELEQYAAQLREQFVHRFLDSAGNLTSGTQTGYLCALAWNLTPEAGRDRLAQALVELVEHNGRRLTTGFHGVALLCPTLTAIGRADLAYDILLQPEYPSWAYSIAHGATSIWERWDGWTEERGFQSVTMNSFNHYSLGSVGEWVYRSVCGIDHDPAVPGWRRIRIAPQLTDRLRKVEGYYESPRGRIEVGWHRVDDGVDVQVLVPPGATAAVRLPGIEAKVASGHHSFWIEAASQPTVAVTPRSSDAQ